MLDDYKKKKNTRDKYINSVFICILLLIMLGVGFVAYSFYQSISGNKQYNIGSGNRYMNIIQNTIHGEKVDDEEDNSLNLMKIQEQNKQIIQSCIESLSKQRISEEDSFLKRFQVSTEIELNADSNVIEPELIPCVVFTAFSNPTNTIGAKFPGISIMSMTDMKFPTLSRHVFSKSSSVRNIIKGTKDIKLETHFSVNTNKYILFSSVLSTIKSIPTERNNEAIYVWIDPNSFVPPHLLAHFISILRSTTYSPQENSMSIFTAKTITVSKLNKRTPYVDLKDVSMENATHHMDLLIFRDNFMDLLIKELPEDGIVENIQSIVLNVADHHNVKVIDISSILFCMKKLLVYNIKEKPFQMLNSDLIEKMGEKALDLNTHPHYHLQPISSFNFRIIENESSLSSKMSILSIFLQAGLSFFNTCTLFAENGINPEVYYFCKDITVYAGKSICEEQKQYSLTLQDSTHLHITCVYPPTTLEASYMRSIQLGSKSDFLLLNTTNNQIFFTRFNQLLERKGKVLVFTSNMEELSKQVGKKFNVLYKSDNLMLFSN